ncbi:MAG TPA: cytochrome c [Pirellulaceae bacterium]|nr:cytochrome c [Pirellulaceae bacterium]
MLRYFILFAIAFLCLASARAEEKAAERGFHWLTEKPYLPLDFDQETFDAVWQTWPEPLRAAAEKASVEQRREMAFDRYGLTKRPNDTSGKPLQYVVDERGVWTMNCFACHGGQVAGKSIPGLPNSMYALETLTDEMRETKLLLRKKWTRMDLGGLVMPLGTTNGTTNAVMFGVALMNYRDADLNIIKDRLPPKMTHHDMDPPPWWHFQKKSHIYIDGFAEKGSRGLMQFMLIKENGPGKFREWEKEFDDVYAYISEIEPPAYPFKIDRALAAQGEKAFTRSCSACHGTYGERETYPEKMVTIDEIGTDRVRFDALSEAHRRGYGESWFAHYGKQNTLAKPAGYVAPPFDGIWASAPYFHNGSVPTLWHVLHPQDRPAVWRRASIAGYDQTRVGIEVETLNELPAAAKNDKRQRREYFNTKAFGKSAAGHEFVEELSGAEKAAVLEYLKTL